MNYTKEDKLLDVLRDLFDDDVVEIWNDYCDLNNYDDYRIYPIGDLDDWFCGMTATEILEACSGVDTSDLYFRDTTAHGVQTTSSPWDWIDEQTLIEHILDEQKSYDIDEIQEILDEPDDEEEA